MDETLKEHPDYDRHCAEWRRTLPNAPDAVIHDKVTKHIAFKEKTKAVASTAASNPPPPPRKPWELRAIIVLLALILISMIAKIAHGEPAPPLPLPFSHVMMLPQAGSVPIPLPIQGSGSSSPVYVICSSGCSAAGAFADNSSFTVGTTPGSILFGYYTSGAAPTLTSGSAARARIDANSYLAVDCVTGCSAAAGFADNSAFTAGTTAIGITGGWYAVSPTACTTGNACAPSMTSDRKMFVQDFQGTSPWVVSNSGTFAVQAAQSGTWTVTGAGGTFPVTGTFWQATQPVSGTFWQATQPVSGTFWQTTQPVSGTFWQTTQPVSAASLPLPTGASTAAKQPALGTAGSASADVITVQGIASMTALKVDGSGVTQPISGSVTVTQATGTNLHAVLDTTSTTAVTQATASNLNAAVVGVGTAGSPSGGILTVQGVASMTKLLVTPDSVALPANQSVNVSQVNGTTTLTGTGAVGSGAQRVAVGTDTATIAGSSPTSALAAAGVGATGSAVPANASYGGGNGSGNTTGYLNCDNTAVYDASTNGATQLVALASGKIVYVCGFQISQSTATSVHVSLEYGTGTACATSPSKITPAYPLQAATSTGPIGMVVMTPGYTGLKTTASQELCLLTDAAVSVQALVWWTQF